MDMDIDNNYNDDYMIYFNNSKKIEFIERKIHILDIKMNEINSKLDNLYDNFLIILKTIENQNKIMSNKFNN